MENTTLNPAQIVIAKDLHRFRVVNCGRRFGKTTLAVLEIIAKACLNDNQRIAYMAPTYPQARDIAWQEFQRRMPRDSSAKPQYNESRLEIKINNGSHIWLKGWENIETVRGMAFDFIVIDEIAMMRNFWLQWEEVIRPTLTDTRGHVMFISTPKGYNHFYDLYLQELQNHDFKSFHFTSYDNPHIPKEEIDTARKEMTQDRFGQEYLADFKKTEGLVYKEFNRDLHIFDECKIRTFTKTDVPIDFGFTNPTAMLQIKTDYDNNYWIMQEFYKTGQTIEQLKEALNVFKPNVVYPDPEAPDRIQELRLAGFNVREVQKGKDSVKNGIDKVRELFKQNRIKIHKSCVNLILELETYRYPDHKPDKNEDELPVKENDHAVDCLRYYLMTHHIDGSEPLVINSNISYQRR